MTANKVLILIVLISIFGFRTLSVQNPKAKGNKGIWFTLGTVLRIWR